MVEVPTTAPECRTRTVHENVPDAPYTVKSTRSVGRAPASAVAGRAPAVTEDTRTSSGFGASVDGADDGDVDPHPATAVPPTDTLSRTPRTAILIVMSTS